MELEKQILHRNKEVGRSISQITLDDDYNLPDYKPDLTKVIREKGQIIFDEVHTNNGHVWFKGVLEFWILYRTDLDSKKINCLSGEIPFQESLAMDGVDETDSVKIEGRIEDISVSVINSRKLSIRSLVELCGTASRPEEEGILTGVLGENSCEIEREKIEALELVTDKKDTLRIRNELSLSSNKPNIDEILWSSIELRGIEGRLKNGEIVISGEALVYVLYCAAEEEERIQWYETTVPIHGSVDCNVCDENLIYQIKTELLHKHIEVHPDEDGEARNLLLEMVINLSICFWKEENLEMICDMYALDRQLKPEYKTVYFEKLLIKNQAKCRIADKIELEKEQEEILQICVNEANLTIEQISEKEEGVLAEGILTVDILYLTADDSMPIGGKRAYLPFTQLIETPKASLPIKIYLEGEIEQVTTVLADNKTIDVKAVIGLNLLVFEQEKKQTIVEIKEEALDLEALQQSPGIIGYMVRPGDRLFNIAKENHTTVENLMETNHLSGKTVSPGEKLLIVKTVG